MKLFTLLTCCLILFCVSCSYPIHRNSDDYMTARSLLIQGSTNLLHGNYAEAEAAFLLSHEIIQSAVALDGLGCVAMLTGDSKSAQRYFIDAYALDNYYYNALSNLALLYDLLGYTTEAQELYEKTLISDPNNYKTHNNFAAFLYDLSINQTDLKEQARKELLKAKSLSSDELIIENLNKMDSI